MATAITGAVSLNDINLALGIASGTPISFNDTLYRQLTNQSSGAADLNNAHACVSINSTTINLNILSGLFGNSGTVANYKVLVRSGVNIGASSGNNALTVGQFASGSSVVINNYGNILGYGGAGGGYYSSGTSGGDAIYAAYPNQTVTINNKTGALIYSGGGGGGSGGLGGGGGNGGGGYYVAQSHLGPANSCDTYCPSRYGYGYCASVIPDNCFTYGPKGGYYYVGATCNDCINDYNVYTGGGGGGGGGAGGAGGRGYGYDGANAGGAGGNPGAGGGGGGPNAGNGGYGGYGGSGGTGGGWGAAGGAGNTGASGNSGAGGNNGGGAGGSAGGGGAGGGAAGRYLVKSSYSVTLNNSGGLAGGLA